MSRHRWGRAAPLFAIALLAAGCASMHGGRSQVVLVASEPPGARILVGGEPAGVTPNFVRLQRHGAVITLDKDGFLPQQIAVPRSVARRGWLLGDVALGALLLLARGAYALSMWGLTLGVDLATGAAWEFPDEVTAALEPAPPDPEPTVPDPHGIRGTSSDHPREDTERTRACLDCR